MAKITKLKSGTTYSYKITLPKELAEEFIEKYGTDITIKRFGKGFKLSATEVSMKKYKIICENCNGQMKINKANGDVVCTNCNSVLNDEDIKQILDDTYKEVLHET